MREAGQVSCFKCKVCNSIRCLMKRCVCIRMWTLLAAARMFQSSSIQSICCKQQFNLYTSWPTYHIINSPLLRWLQAPEPSSIKAVDGGKFSTKDLSEGTVTFLGMGPTVHCITSSLLYAWMSTFQHCANFIVLWSLLWHTQMYDLFSLCGACGV